MIRFSLWGIPVRVRPTFWLIAVLLGLNVGDRALLVAWVAVVFVSVLVHELGHALTARSFGAQVSITLTTFGGYTEWVASKTEISAGRRALIAAAGSAVGILLGLATYAVFYLTRPWGGLAASIVSIVVWVNVGWGVLNWLPLRPLDGGHLVLAFLEMLRVRKSERVASVLFVVTGLAAVAAGLYFGFVFAAFLAGFMTWMEITRLFPAPTAPRAAPEFSYDDPPAEPKPSEE